MTQADKKQERHALSCHSETEVTLRCLATTGTQASRALPPLGAAAGVPQLFPIAVGAVYLPSDMAFRSQGPLFLFTFLKDNCPNIALESKEKFWVLNSAPVTMWLREALFLLDLWGWQGSQGGSTLAAFGHGLATYNLKNALQVWVIDNLVLDLQQASPRAPPFSLMMKGQWAPHGERLLDTPDTKHRHL